MTEKKFFTPGPLYIDGLVYIDHVTTPKNDLVLYETKDEVPVLIEKVASEYLITVRSEVLQHRNNFQSREEAVKYAREFTNEITEEAKNIADRLDKLDDGDFISRVINIANGVNIKTAVVDENKPIDTVISELYNSVEVDSLTEHIQSIGGVKDNEYNK
ncbi:MAG: hypothetical protein ABIB43_05765 [archaeon]